MEASLPRLKPEVQAGVANYVVRLGELMGLCADYVEVDPEIFLWNARRVLEVLCHILYSVHEDRISRTDGESGNMQARLAGLSKRDLIDDQYHTSLDSMRRHTNLGVHIRSPQREDYPLARKHVREQLPDVVEWLFRTSKAAHYITRPDALMGHIERIRGRQPMESTGTVRFQELTEPTVQVAHTVAPARPNRLPAVALGVLLGAGGLVAVRSLTMAPGPPIGERLVAPSQTPVAPALAQDVPPTCPDGMVLVDRTRLRLGPPEGGRKDWPQAARSILNEVEVEPFCVDAKARIADQLMDWTDAPRVRTRGCYWRDQAIAAPVVCLNRDEASSYCASRGWRLPSILEWEALVRSPESGAKPDNVREWVRDDFPPSALGYDPDPAEASRYGLFRQKLRGDVDPLGAPLNSWNKQELGNRYENLGFRCATDPT